MTPKEKAIELLKKYELMAEFVSIEFPEEITNPIRVKNAKVELASKKCALIAINEIIKSEPSLPNNQVPFSKRIQSIRQDFIDANNYWLEVKQEIELL